MKKQVPLCIPTYLSKNHRNRNFCMYIVWKILCRVKKIHEHTVATILFVLFFFI